MTKRPRSNPVGSLVAVVAAVAITWMGVRGMNAKMASRAIGSASASASTSTRASGSTNDAGARD
jgi:hypothetical protein